MRAELAPDHLKGEFAVYKLLIGERFYQGDYWLDQWGELKLVDWKPPFFNRNVTKMHGPFYRIFKLRPYKKDLKAKNTK